MGRSPLTSSVAVAGKACKPLADIKHGQIACSSVNEPDSHCKIKCSKNHFATGSTHIYCSELYVRVRVCVCVRVRVCVCACVCVRVCKLMISFSCKSWSAIELSCCTNKSRVDQNRVDFYWFSKKDLLNCKSEVILK